MKTYNVYNVSEQNVVRAGITFSPNSTVQVRMKEESADFIQIEACVDLKFVDDNVDKKEEPKKDEINKEEPKEEKKEYKCQFCEKTYKSKVGLKNHVKKEHGGE